MAGLIPGEMDILLDGDRVNLYSVVSPSQLQGLSRQLKFSYGAKNAS
jgi:hypothetical protein